MPAVRAAGRRLAAPMGALAARTRRAVVGAVAAGGGVPPPLRALLVAAVTAGTGVLLAGLLLFAASGPGGAGGADPLAVSDQHRQRVEAVAHLRQARLHLEEGDPEAALPFLREAEAAAPDLAWIEARRSRVEEQARSLGQLEVHADRVAWGLEQARTAAEERRWADARAASQIVLGLEAENPEALEILERSEAAIARAERRREELARQQAEEREAEERVADAELPPPPPAVEEVAPTGEAQLDLYFYSALPEGVLTVYFNRRQLIREPYRFFRREGLFRTIPTAGEIANAYTVPPGNATLQVLVALPGRPSLTEELEGNFPDGVSRRLNVRLTEDRHLVARLE